MPDSAAPDQPPEADKRADDCASPDSRQIMQRFNGIAEAFRNKSRHYDELLLDFQNLTEFYEQTRDLLNEQVKKTKDAESQLVLDVAVIETLKEENERSRERIAQLQKLAKFQASCEERELGEGQAEPDESMEAPREWWERPGLTVRRSSIRHTRHRSLSPGVRLLKPDEPEMSNEPDMLDEPYTPDEDVQSLVFRPHCFRELTKGTIYCADGCENEPMLPRCKQIRPYILWEKQVVPPDFIEEPPQLPVTLLSRVYCNCGWVLTQEDEECDCPVNEKKRHKFFFRKNFYKLETHDQKITQRDRSLLKNMILPNLSSIDIRRAPTTFDLIAQVTNLRVEQDPSASKTGRVPPCILTVWDGTVPPELIGKEQFLRDIATKADKTISGGSLPWDMPRMLVDVLLGNFRKVAAGEFVILRDVMIVKAYSIGQADGTLSNVWMLQARDMDVIRGHINDREERAAFFSVASHVSTCVILMGVDGEASTEAVWEVENGLIAFLDARKRKQAKGELGKSGDEPAAKRAELDGTGDSPPPPPTWMIELLARDEHNHDAKGDLTLEITFGNYAPPPAVFESFDENKAKVDEFMASLSLQHLNDSPRSIVWLCWMTTCNTNYTIREHDDDELVGRAKCASCNLACGGTTALFVHIPVLAHQNAQFVHLLINVSHFRKNKRHCPLPNWSKRQERNQIRDIEKIMEKINESTITLHRATLTMLKWKKVYVVASDEQNWITVADR